MSKRAYMNEVIVNKFKKLLRVPYPTEFIDNTIPIFCPRTEEQRSKDKYDKDFEVVLYTGIYAFGYQLFDFGEAEGLYRTVNSLLLSNLDKNKANLILDVGCGVGRTLYDCAELYPNSLFIGMDYSYNMIRRAKDILLSGKLIEIDLSKRGFKKVSFKGKSLNNVILAQGDVLNLPFNPESFDCVINTYLIDRVKGSQKGASTNGFCFETGRSFHIYRSLNFETKNMWVKMPNKDKVIKMLESQGIKIREWFDGLVYREVIDSRGNYTDWGTLVICGSKNQEVV